MPGGAEKSVLPPLSEVRGGVDHDSVGQHDHVRLADKLQRTSPGASAGDSWRPKGKMGEARQELAVREDDSGDMPLLPEPPSLHWGVRAKGRWGQNCCYHR